MKIIAFDVYGTLFDVYSLGDICEKCLGEKGRDICVTWRQKQLEYSFLRELMNNYIEFSKITKDALQYACEVNNVKLTKEVENILLSAYLTMKPYREVLDVLDKLKKRKDIKLCVFSNGDFSMLMPLLKNNEMLEKFHEILTVDERKHYKPSNKAYSIVTEKFNAEPEDVIFLSCNTWDITGATHFGFKSVWVNRDNIVLDKLGINPCNVIKDLTELPKIINRYV